MQIHISDPAHTGSERARANFRLAAKIALGFVVLLWLIQLLNGGLDLGLQRFGVRPREFAGLPGILLAPLLHGGFPHLVTNSLPLLVLGTVMLHIYPNSAIKVIPVVYLGPGIAVWLFAKESTIHVGASGLVYVLTYKIFRHLRGDIFGLSAHAARGRAYVSVYHRLPRELSLEHAQAIVARHF